MKHMTLLRSLLFNDDNQAINILAPTELNQNEGGFTANARTCVGVLLKGLGRGA